MHAVGLLVSLCAATLAATALSTAHAEPYLEMLDACRAEPNDPEVMANLLVDAGWHDVTSSETYAAFIEETLNQQARARLSAASYPDAWWTDEAVRGSYPSIEVTSLRDLELRIEANVSNSQLSDVRMSRVLHVEGDRNAWVVLYAPSGSPVVQCWLVAMSDENPTLSNDFRSNSRRAERGYTMNQWPLEGLRASVTLLSDHAVQNDALFPVHFDLSLAVAVQKTEP